MKDAELKQLKKLWHAADILRQGVPKYNNNW